MAVCSHKPLSGANYNITSLALELLPVHYCLDVPPDWTNNRPNEELHVSSYTSFKYHFITAGLKIIFERWLVMLTSQTNFSFVTSCFSPVKILKIFISKNFPIKPKISPHMHKNDLLKGIKNSIPRSIT